MRFQKTPRHEAYAVTSRKVAAYERKKIAQQNALPLFAEATAATQISADEEMQRRILSSERSHAERRSQIASQWREVRTRLAELPAHVRAPILERWKTWTGPTTALMLGHIIKSEAAELTASPDDFPLLDSAQRLERTRHFNDLALADNPYARSKRFLSHNVMLWLSPFFEPTPENPAPRMYLETNMGLLMMLHYALAGFDTFGHNTDPTGEHRSGSFNIGSTSFRFFISYHRHNSDEPSSVPWSTDLTRRVLWIGLADDPQPFLQDA